MLMVPALGIHEAYRALGHPGNDPGKIRAIPLPMPLSVIRSPIHISCRSRGDGEGSVTQGNGTGSQTANPDDHAQTLMKARTTVR